MEQVLTGKFINAEEAEKAGLVARVFPAASLLEEVLKVAKTIASYSLPSVLMAKEAVNKCKGQGPIDIGPVAFAHQILSAAFEVSLTEGLHFERRLFHSLFATVRWFSLASRVISLVFRRIFAIYRRIKRKGWTRSRISVSHTGSTSKQSDEACLCTQSYAHIPFRCNHIYTNAAALHYINLMRAIPNERLYAKCSK